MATDNKSSIINLLPAVLSNANSEANQTYPPGIYSDQYNVVTSLLISALVKTYPIGLDMLRPFIKTYKHAVQNGYFVLPEDYRNMLGASINSRNDGMAECSDEDPVVIDNEQEVKLATLKAGCRSRPIEFLSETEWDYRTTSTYKFPTFTNPIGCFFGSEKFKVCPFDIGVVELRYVRNEDIGVLGYLNQPDDTYIVNPLTTKEVGWTSAAFDKLYTAMTSLYASYTRDPSLTNWSQLLQQQGIL